MDIITVSILILAFIALGIDYFDCKDKFIVSTIRATTVVLIVVCLAIGISVESYAFMLESAVTVASYKAL